MCFQMHPVWLCILLCKCFEDTLENTQRRNIEQMHPLMPALWGHIWKPTVKKSQTNATIVIMHPFTHPFEDTFKMHSGEMQPMWSCIHPGRQFEEAYENMHVTMPPRMHILKSWMIELDLYFVFLYCGAHIKVKYKSIIVKYVFAQLFSICICNASCRYWSLHIFRQIFTIIAILISPYIYSCPSLVVRFLEELISRTFLDENQFRLVSQDRVRSQNRIGCLVFVSRTVLSCLTHSPLINAECQEDSIVFLLKRPKWISHRWNFEFLFVQDWSRHSISDKQRR